MRVKYPFKKLILFLDARVCNNVYGKVSKFCVTECHNMSFPQLAFHGPKKRKRKCVTNPNSKEHIHSMLWKAVQALNIWCIDYLPPMQHKWVVYSNTCDTQRKRFNDGNYSLLKGRRREPFEWLKNRVLRANAMSADEIFEALKANVVNVSPCEDKSKSCIRIVVQTPDLLWEWLRHHQTLKDLEAMEENDGHLGSLISKCYDFPEQFANGQSHGI